MAAAEGEGDQDSASDVDEVIGLDAWLERLEAGSASGEAGHCAAKTMRGNWCPTSHAVELGGKAGKLAASMGFSRDGKEWLHAVEALYLLEQGRLSVTCSGEGHPSDSAWTRKEGYENLLPWAGGLAGARTYRKLRDAGLIVRVRSPAALVVQVGPSDTGAAADALLPEVAFEVFARRRGEFARSHPGIPAARVVLVPDAAPLPCRVDVLALYGRCAEADVAATGEWLRGGKVTKKAPPHSAAERSILAAEFALSLLCNSYLPASCRHAAAEVVALLLPAQVTSHQLGRLLQSALPLSSAGGGVADAEPGVAAALAALEWIAGRHPASVDAVCVPVWFALCSSSGSTTLQRLAPLALPAAETFLAGT